MPCPISLFCPWASKSSRRPCTPHSLLISLPTRRILFFGSAVGDLFVGACHQHLANGAKVIIRKGSFSRWAKWFSLKTVVCCCPAEAVPPSCVVHFGLGLGLFCFGIKQETSLDKTGSALGGGGGGTWIADERRSAARFSESYPFLITDSCRHTHYYDEFWRKTTHFLQFFPISSKPAKLAIFRIWESIRHLMPSQPSLPFS